MADVVLQGASEHNLKGVDLRFPRDRLVCFTGVSGSGKSSLAYDTLYKEGQRRFLESLSSYARQFMGRIEKPKVEHVEGLSPTVAIDQKSVSRNPRSTVGTITEVWDFLRLLMARLGTPRCHVCGAEVVAFAPEQIVDEILASGKAGEALLVLAPIVRGRKGSYRKELEELRQQGFVRARIDGQVLRLEEEIQLHRYKKHDIEVVLDRVKIGPDRRARLLESISQALSLGEGFAATLRKTADGEEHRIWSSLRACPNGHGSIPELEPRLFSFNSPQGACPTCDGLGESRGFSQRAADRGRRRSACATDALHCFNKKGFVHYTRIHLEHIDQVLQDFGGSIDVPLEELLQEGARSRSGMAAAIASGTSSFVTQAARDARSAARTREPWEGIARHPRIGSTANTDPKSRCNASSPSSTCPVLQAASASRPAALAVTFREPRDHADLREEHRRRPRVAAANPGTELEKPPAASRAEIGRELFRELLERLDFLEKVGLGYLALDRSAATLSRRRVAAHPSRGAGRLRPARHPLRARRAVDRPALRATTTG